MSQIKSEAATALMVRKKLLVAQGAAFRAEISQSRHIVHANLRAESLAKNMLSHVLTGAYSAVKTGAAFKGGNLQMLLPIVVGSLSALSRKSLLKPVLGGAVVIGVVGAIARAVWKRKANGN